MAEAPAEAAQAAQNGAAPPELSPDQAALLEARRRRIQAMVDAYKMPEGADAEGRLSGQDARDRTLAEMYVMLEDLYNGFTMVFQQFQQSGGGIGGLLKMLKG